MSRSAATPIVPGLWRIPTMGRSAINSYAFEDPDGSVTLVDCGLAKAQARIAAGLAAMGKHVQDVTRIVLTHVHIDHVSGAAQIAETSGAQVIAHPSDVAAAASGRVPKSDPTLLSARIFNRLGPNKFPPVEVGRTLTDNQVLDIAGGVRVIHTPGHSPGHVSLLHESSKVLITGDALFNLFGGLTYPPKFLCADFRMTQKAAHVFGELDYDIATFTHGPEIRGSPREKIRRFLSRH